MQIIVRTAAIIAYAALSTSAWAQEPIDLTGVVLSSRDPDCASYVGRYTSHITDAETGRTLEGALQISATSDSCVFRTNQIPNHDVGEGNPRWRESIEENNLVVAISRQPTKAQQPSPLQPGPNVILLNGVKWDGEPAACFGVGGQALGRERTGCGQDQADNPWRYDVGSPLNNFELDNYSAHLQPDGVYHYHKMPLVLYRTECSAGPSPVIGFAIDGFPVYGPCIQASDGTVHEAKSSYVLREGVRQPVAGYATPYKVGDVASDSYNGQFIGDYMFVEGAGDLDMCNGAEVDGQYGYYLTEGYPYVLVCLSGTPKPQFR